ncbi:acetyl-CoA C-acyltransferase [Halalkalibacter sp. APA_J-10(15)]|uniref:acetyl-CoA C-acyltransferase n=1 Tax=Halalkalibacter sp. APA_J-10(15) TaxID=2933805 RepID=UPI001FF3C8C8|nr:acetyl-CoA C-acyltransferase [Halalkalibacter sp. APA_J-10(15)]MCK0470969.1 acetyl-CoA C-acyltransferase [Halalkalibacter sp. APA_J-10(15)]
MREAVIVSIARTPVGKAKKGAFVQTRIEDLGKVVLQEVIRRAPGVTKEDVDDVIIGCAMPEGEQGLNMARTITLYAGFPVSVPAITINRFCSSGLQSIALAADRILAGGAETIIAGGMESMSHVPMTGFHFSPHPVMVDEMPNVYMGMGMTAEVVAERFHVSREEQDQFAVKSHQKAARALANGNFTEEIVPVETLRTQFVDNQLRKWKVEVKQDEGVRSETNAELLREIKPAFKQGGTVTAGNASQMSDGAAASIVMSKERAEALGLEPLATFRSFALAGVEPDIMGVGPVKAIPKALEMAQLSIEDVDLFEINEAFASQCLHIIRELHLDEDKVNVNGGAIALGHPLGCTGTKLTATLLYELKRRGGGIGVVSMCIGGGMGAAAVIEVNGERGREK